MQQPKVATGFSDIIMRFSVFTGFWAIAYFFMCLTAFAVARPQWTFVINVHHLLLWFGVYMGAALAIGNLIGVVSNLIRPQAGTMTHGDFNGRFAGNWAQVAQFCFGTLVSGIVFLALARVTAGVTQQWFAIQLDILEGASFPIAAVAVAVESLATTLLVLAIIFYAKGQLEAAWKARQSA